VPQHNVKMEPIPSPRPAVAHVLVTVE